MKCNWHQFVAIVAIVIAALSFFGVFKSNPVLQHLLLNGVSAKPFTGVMLFFSGILAWFMSVEPKSKIKELLIIVFSSMIAGMTFTNVMWNFIPVDSDLLVSGAAPYPSLIALLACFLFAIAGSVRGIYGRVVLGIWVSRLAGLIGVFVLVGHIAGVPILYLGDMDARLSAISVPSSLSIILISLAANGRPKTKLPI